MSHPTVSTYYTMYSMIELIVCSVRNNSLNITLDYKGSTVTELHFLRFQRSTPNDFLFPFYTCTLKYL